MRFIQRSFPVARAALVAALVAGSLSLGDLRTAPSSAHASSPVQLTFYYWTTTGIPRDLPLVQNAINQYIQPRIGAEVSLKPIDIGSYNQRMQLINASGQPYDIAFAAPWINNYDQLAREGAIIPLDSLLHSVGKGLYATMPPSVWNAARVNGKIYGVLNQSYFPTPFGIEVRKDLATKYHLNLSKITSYAQLTPFLAAVKKGEPGVTPIFATIDTDLGEVKMPNDVLDPVIATGEIGTVGVLIHSPKPQVVTSLALPQFTAAANLARQWYLAGYYGPEPKPDAVARAGLKAGEYAVELDQCRPETAANLKAVTGYDWICIAIGQPVLTTANVKANLLVISRTSKHPAAALEFLQLLNTDKTLYNLISYGMEGRNWVWVNKAENLIGFPKGVTSQTDGYNPGTPFMFGNVFNSYYNDPSEVGQWPLAEKLQAAALRSPALGFDWNDSQVTSQEAAVNSVLNPCVANLLLGLKPVGGYLQSCLQQARAAGLNAVIANMQQQLTAWQHTQAH